MNFNKMELMFLMNVVARMNHRLLNQQMKIDNLEEFSHPGILFAIEKENKSDWSQRDIAARLGISEATVAVSIKRMEAAGLIVRDIDPSNRRKNNVVLSEKARKLLSESKRTISSVEKKILKNFSDDDKNNLRNYLIMMAENLEDEGIDLPGFIQDRK